MARFFYSGFPCRPNPLVLCSILLYSFQRESTNSFLGKAVVFSVWVAVSGAALTGRAGHCGEEAWCSPVQLAQVGVALSLLQSLWLWSPEYLLHLSGIVQADAM